jgi:hypothetical protein
METISVGTGAPIDRVSQWQRCRVIGLIDSMKVLSQQNSRLGRNIYIETNSLQSLVSIRACALIFDFPII